jgi:Glycosyl transferase family 8
MTEVPRIFIGSGEASLLERKVLIYSLKKHARGPLDIRVFNGTHDCLELEHGEPLALRTPLHVKFCNITEFSNYRFLIPKLCEKRGRALWIDSDTVCLTDIGELFETDMQDAAVLAKPNAYDAIGSSRWGLSVSLYDCERCPFDLQEQFEEIGRGLYSYEDLHQISPAFLAARPFSIKPLDPRWNEFDRYNGETKLIHYTNLLTQPWKFRGHPYGGLWFRYFEEARHQGFVTDEDIEKTLMRAYARQDLLEGNDWTLAGLARSFLTGNRALIENRVRRWLR